MIPSNIVLRLYLQERPAGSKYLFLPRILHINNIYNYMQKNKTKINSGYGDHHNRLTGQTVMVAPIRKENTSKTSQNKTYTK